jgi:hypothetical protein
MDFCFGIPVPHCLAGLGKAPPACILSPEDLQTVQILRDFGQELNRPKDEIAQACKLATGLSDIVVILDRPPPRLYQAFGASFGKFVQSYQPLAGVDELLRLGSNSARSIHSVTVLYAYSYQPVTGDLELDRRCEEVLARLLQVKRPKVIIHCRNGDYSDPWMTRFNFPDRPIYQLQRDTVEIAEDRQTVVISSFPPLVRLSATRIMYSIDVSFY